MRQVSSAKPALRHVSIASAPGVVMADEVGHTCGSILCLGAEGKNACAVPCLEGHETSRIGQVYIVYGTSASKSSRVEDR